MTVATEREQVVNLFKQVEEIEAVASAGNLLDDQRTVLQDVVRSTLGRCAPVRVNIAADILELSDKTVRNWIEAGVLFAHEGERRTLLEPERLHAIMHAVRDLRANGQDRHLLEAVWNRLHDDLELEDQELQTSLAQMRRKEGVLLEDGSDESDDAPLA